MINNGFIALRGQHSFHMVERKSIKEVEMGERKTKIVTPYHTLEVETLYNMAALSSLCQEPLPEMFQTEEDAASDLYPRLNDLPF
ncbi:hypothetical protein [Persicitalea jodogahamensis]|uniref:Uncharacterized protein n=1 Tax=Persicitalea jodogahamensis TaxID=402147 RepID=A0A8J3D5D1_9BACT|nr:hypothetical protein [Persicitalea jodogahamensis]GHB76400.1 hypothetical protein GCM10007390_32910 [Persicitalea jodogahamensis]